MEVSDVCYLKLLFGTSIAKSEDSRCRAARRLDVGEAPTGPDRAGAQGMLIFALRSNCLLAFVAPGGGQSAMVKWSAHEFRMMLCY